MKHVSTGTGLSILGVGIALHPLLSGLGASATGSVASHAAAAVASAADAHLDGGPSVVWMGVTGTYNLFAYHRLWSDGRLEMRRLGFDNGSCSFYTSCEAGAWREVPTPPGGNGVACRTDVNGDRMIDALDLASVLNDWGDDVGCEPTATYPCLALDGLGGAARAK